MKHLECYYSLGIGSAASVAKACMHAKLLQSYLTFGDPVGYSLPGSSVHGISQARILDWAAMSSSRGSSPPRDQTHVSYVF